MNITPNTGSGGIVLFTGPTLGAAEAKALTEARVLPPVKLGDIYRAVTIWHPAAIGIIDGYFNQVPAVWHKEILWALQQGVQVFGGASMGALRAAELAAFGMQGIGEIFTAYREGRFPPFGDPFEDDDEVAVIHGPAELGFPAASEAMVNIRATLAAAAQAGVIAERSRDRLAEKAKTRFYAERGFDILLQDAGGAVPAGELDALAKWLPRGRVDLKRRDALALIQVLADASRNPPADVPHFRLERTTLWENVVREMEALPPPTSPVLDELRLLGDDYLLLRERVLTGTFGARRTDQAAGAPGEEWHHAPLRARRLAQWRNSAPEHWIAERMLAMLAESGDLEILEHRAADKEGKLAGRRLPHAADLAEIESLQLMDWYFGQCLGREMPDDIAGYAARLGGLSPGELEELVLREYFYQHPEA